MTISSPRTRKKRTREEDVIEVAATALPDAAFSPEGKGKKTKRTKEPRKKRNKSSEPKAPAPTAEEETATLLAGILPQSISEDPSSLLSHLLVDIQLLANSKKRCTGALRALKDGKGVASPYFDKDDDEEGGTVEEVPVAARKGKKRTRSADKTKKKKEGVSSFEESDGGDNRKNEETVQGIRDAHLIMATTQAINVLLTYLRSRKEEKAESEEAAMYVALVLAALSHHLIAALVNDKSLLESITTPSQYPTSHSSSSLGGAASSSSPWGSIHDEGLVMEGNNASTSGRGRKEKESEASEIIQHKLGHKREVTVSYAKAVAGRAITSSVVGAINAIETFGKLTFGDDEKKIDEEGDRSDPKVEYNILRRGVWTCLLALEMAFQLSSRPKVLSASIMSSSSLDSKSAMAASYASGIDFDGMISAVMGSPSECKGNGKSWMHAHTMMGGRTLAMWNDLLDRIMADYKLGFHLLYGCENLEEENLLVSMICKRVTESAFSDEDNSKFISIVLDKITISSTSPGNELPTKKSKKGTKTKKLAKNKPTDQGLSELSSLLASRQENFMLFECHVSFRHWSTLAFGWLCSGQTRCLGSCTNMLSRKHYWTKVLEMAPIESNLTAGLCTPKPISSKKKKDSKTKSSSSSSTAVDPSPNKLRGLRGDLALVIFTSCMVDLVSTAGISSSSSGWIDRYVNAITDVAHTVVPLVESNPAFAEKVEAEDEHVRRRTRTRSKIGISKNDTAMEASCTSNKVENASWVRRDITNEVTFLTKLLIEAHTSCLQDSFRDHLLESERVSTLKSLELGARKLLINDDDSYRDSSTYRLHDPKEFVNIISYYPFIHRSLETLGQMVASSSFVSSLRGKSRIAAIGCALALHHFTSQYQQLEIEGSVVVLDAKLVSFGIAQLFEAFNSLPKNSDTGNVNSNSSMTYDQSALLDFLAKYRLDEPLNIERLENKGSALDSRTTKDLTVQSEVLSCFIRAQLNQHSTMSYHLSGMKSLLKSLVLVIHMCYKCRSERLTPASESKLNNKRKKTIKLYSTCSNKHSSNTMTRCVLAADTLNFLRVCLTRRDLASLTKETELLCISAFFTKNEVFSTEMIKDLVDLGYVLKDKIIYPRIGNVVDKASFIPEERLLWSTHIKLYLTISRGQAKCTQPVTHLLGNSCRRLEIFQHIAKVEQDRHGVESSEYYWPLSLSVLHHALVGATLSCVESDEKSSAEPELFLCNAFLNSLESDHVMNRSDTTDHVSISLQDARVFVLAATKLEKEQQKRVFKRLIFLLQSKVSGLKCSTSHNANQIDVLAKGLCLATNMADVLTTTGFGLALSRIVASSHYNIPPFAKKIGPEEDRVNKDAMYMGLFDDSNSPSVPATGISSSTTLSEVEFKQLAKLVKSSLQLGFELSSVDGCHLLFSSWNSSGKLCSWTSLSWEGPRTFVAIEKEDTLDRLISLRDELCEISHLFKNESLSCEQSLLEKTTANKGGHCRASEALVSGIITTEHMIKRVASEITTTDFLSKIETSSLPMFAYLEALPVFLSFLMSMHTKAGSNNFSYKHRFSKLHVKRSKLGYKDEEVLDEFPPDDSDYESTLESGGGSLKIRALKRLHDACASLGAAPCWPDWLDTSCSMQIDLTPSMAVDSANSALSCLTTLGGAVYKRYHQALQDALSMTNYSSLDENTPISSNLLHYLIVLQQHLSSSSEHDAFQSYLSALSKTDVATLKYVAENRYSLPNNRFATYSVQRSKGADSTSIKDPNMSELRANEQWEMIIAEVIRGSSLRNDLPADKPDLKEALENACRWRRVLHSVINAMVPTTALLRFALYDSKGRKPHPLCNDSQESAHSLEAVIKNRFLRKNEVWTNIKKALAFLSYVSAFSTVDDSLRRTSQAVSNHLVENLSESQFNDLILLQTTKIRFDAIQGLYDVTTKGHIAKPTLDAVFAVIDGVFRQISSVQNDSALLVSLGHEEVLQTRLVGDIEMMNLSSIISSEPDYYPSKALISDIVKLFLVILSNKESPQSLKSTIVETLCRLIYNEEQLLERKNPRSTGSIRLAAAIALNGLTKDDFRLLMSTVHTASQPFTQNLIDLLISLVTAKHDKKLSGKGCRIILDVIVENMNQWATTPVQSLMTSLICILATRFGTLSSLITDLLQFAEAADRNYNLMKCIQNVFRFVVALKKCTKQGCMESIPECNEEKQDISNRQIQGRTCTFTQTGEGFAEQHWYNCYTCGLLWDKGCCSLCAQICHKDHDIGYSRKSSFFCDCGAEDERDTKQKCKCLSPIDYATFDAMGSKSLAAEPKHQDTYTHKQISKHTESIFRMYHDECVQTLQHFSKEVEESKCDQTILRLLEQSLQTSPLKFDFTILASDSPIILNNDIVKPSLSLRCGIPLSLTMLDAGQSMIPIRASKPNSLKIGLISPSSTINLRRNRVGRNLIDSDARGRIVCAEGNSLTFFSAIPCINTRFTDTISNLSRSQLCILGTDKINFGGVHGIALSENSNLLAVWGASNACVVILSKSFDSIERTITLLLQLEPDSSEIEGERLLQCLWLNETMLVGVCGTVVHVFDLATTNSENTCKATANFALAYEDVLIRSAVLTANLSPFHSKEIHKKLVLLLDSGKLHSIDLCVDSDGVLEEEGEMYIEVGAGLSFALAGIRRYCGGEPSSTGSSSTTLGEGSNLYFLRHSNILLYQCISSPVVAMLIDKNGGISGTFEFLPGTISSENLPDNNVELVTGPYLHFQELGTVSREEGIFYRVSCVGRIPSSNQQRLLVIEFNQTSSVSIEEISLSSSFGSSSCNSFVGSCSFSAPYVIGGLSSHQSIDNHTEVYERAYVTMLSINGSIIWYGENLGSTQNNGDEQASIETNNNIYIFEDSSLLNVSEDDCLVFGGDGAGKDLATTKKKLSLNNNDFISSSSKDGCTLTVALRSSVARSSNRASDSDLAIVAIRVLLGSVPNLIPREIAVMGSGRLMKTKRNMKRWYDYILTDEEILLAVRSGFVTVNFSSSHDLTSGAAIDAVEVYAKERSDLRFLAPKSSFAPQNMCNFNWQCHNEQKDLEQILYIKSLIALATTLDDGKRSILSLGGKTVVGQILNETALDWCESEATEESLRTATLSLLEYIENDGTKRSQFIDDCTLQGLMSKLITLGNYIESISSPRLELKINGALDVLIHILQIGANIARNHGGNYKTAMMSLMEHTASRKSLAIEAKKVLDYATDLSLGCENTVRFAQVIFHLSGLILMEISCAESSEKFSEFETLSEYLLHDHEKIVESCCKAIVSACVDNPKSNALADDNPHGYITYQCDACKIFPIVDIRYTIGGEVDIDLCQDCFDMGCTYATSHQPGSPLVIHGRTLCVEDEDMTCDSIWQLKGIVIAAPSTGFPVEDVELALKMSQNTKEHANADGVSFRYSFRARLFSKLLDLISRSLSNNTNPSHHHLINLLLQMVHSPKNEKLRVKRGKEVLKRITESLRDILQRNENDGKVVMLLRTLSSLVTKKSSIDEYPSLLVVKRGKEQDYKRHHHKSKTDPRFICDVHKLPAVRRRCSHGVHKDRRFYVCGLERKSRCAYFKWADTVSSDNMDKQQDNEDSQSIELDCNNEAIFEPIQIELTEILDQGVSPSSSIQSQFCCLIGKLYDDLKDSYSESNTNGSGIADRPSFLLRKEDDQERDIKDGILLSKVKLGKMETDPSTKGFHSSSESFKGSTLLISESLYLFSLVAPPKKWISWYPILCSIITGGSPLLRQRAKYFLQQLCAGSQDLYHRVRDHYVYGYQFRKLLRQSEDLLDNALIIKEMAKQCGVNWRENEFEFRSLHPAGLLGVRDLISEDCFTITYEQTVHCILDELLRTASSHARKCNWKNFCALSEIPADINQSGSSYNNANISEQLLHRPPIIIILWLSSCLRGSNQVKMLQLADIALADVHDQCDVKSGEDVIHDVAQMSPEETLSILTIGDFHAFVVDFIVNGRSKDLRCVAVRVAMKLASHLSDADKNALFRRLVDGLLRHVAAKFGCNCLEFIDLLKRFVQNFNLDLTEVAPCITSALYLQLSAANSCITKSTITTDFRSDLANCIHCHCQCSLKKPTPESSSSNEHETWIEEQTRPCARSRLEALILANSHSEYSSYFQLKSRVVLSEVHLTISDIRGRHVKNIGVYFSPRPVEDASVLKRDEYTRYWQRCGTLSVARHASTASFKLKNHVAAANLKFKYEDFYEKIGGGSNRASDGSFALHCPRCTRQVNNAHGVCGNCGEVAFQCKKCRHINYDRLDAFLCVECGYCTSGVFRYDVTVGMALNAVAILDEDGYQRNVSMLRIATKRHSELRNDLKKIVLAISQQRYKMNGQDEEIEETVLYGPHLKRAFLGRLPKVNDESESKALPFQSGSSSARHGDTSCALTSNRAKSLISLVRQLRNDGAGLTGDGERLSRSEFLQQALIGTGNTGARTDMLDELNETVFGALHGGSSADHSLTRVISRLRDLNNHPMPDDAVLDSDKDGKKSVYGECTRLYSQMREAERECHELTRRIEAWNRLNKDELKSAGPKFPFKSSFSFQATTCSNCAPHIALSLMSLLSVVFETSILQSEGTVTPELIKLLITESDNMQTELKSIKRQSLITLASTSVCASKLILEEIKLRLTAIQDETSAELLGQIVQLDFPLVGEYIDFAVSVLQRENL